MKVIDPGHTYELQGNKGTATMLLQFYMDPERHGGRMQAGTTNQEVARALIDRLQYLERETPWGGDFHMIDNLRDLIVMHEVRAASRKGLCSLAAMHALTQRRDIEAIPPRVDDGHIYPTDLHRAEECGGECEGLAFFRERF